jgi:hypothetical protein
VARIEDPGPGPGRYIQQGREAREGSKARDSAIRPTGTGRGRSQWDAEAEPPSSLGWVPLLFQRQRLGPLALTVRGRGLTPQSSYWLSAHARGGTKS